MSSTTSTDIRKQRRPRWYFGGLASAGAACFTHPIDLIKVLLQTQTQADKLSMVAFATKVLREDGIMRFYNGISASLLRQLTYSMTRFAIYEVGKTVVNVDGFAGKIGLAGMAGFCGGLVGTPADMVNVRMQNDVKLPPEKRRNYKHAIDGMFRVYREEGAARLFNGASTASMRGTIMTVGQLAFYDQTKKLLLQTPYFEDNFLTHFNASLIAGTIATILTQPMDVIKTRVMNSKPGEFKGLADVVLSTGREGPLAFYKGFVPSFVRLAPHTILMFVFLEQLRAHFGYLPEAKT